MPHIRASLRIALRPHASVGVDIVTRERPGSVVQRVEAAAPQLVLDSANGGPVLDAEEAGPALL